MGHVSFGIILPLVVLALILIGVFVWYRRSIAEMKPSEARPISGLRLTAEALHRVPSPPWRVAYEVAIALGDVDHVIVGPPGVIVIRTVIADQVERA